MLLSPWDRFLPSSALHSFMCIILKSNFVSTTFIANYYSGDFFAFTFHHLCRKISGHRNTILNPYHILFMGLLAVCNDIKERNFLMKRIVLALFSFGWECLHVLNILRHHNKPVSFMAHSSYLFILFLLHHHLFLMYFNIFSLVIFWVVLNRYHLQLVHQEDTVFREPI